MWGEQCDSDVIDGQVWPRAAAVGRFNMVIFTNFCECFCSEWIVLSEISMFRRAIVESDECN
jgi:hypothetical protein